MPLADHQGVRIYYEVEGEGSPILLAHGLGEHRGLASAVIEGTSFPDTQSYDERDQKP